MTAQPLPATFNSEPFYKQQFAANMHQGYTPFLAALRIWGQDQAGFCYQIAQKWEHDPYVKEHLEKLKAADTAKDELPTKEQFLRDLRTTMQTINDADDYIKAAKLYAEVAGFIEKPAPAVAINNNVQNFERVMIVKDHGSDDEWEAKLRAQQAKLVSNNG